MPRHPQNAETFKELIEILKEERNGISNRELAKAIGISPTVIDWSLRESPRYPEKNAVLDKIAAYSGVPGARVYELAGHIQTRPIYPPDVQAFADALLKIKEKQPEKAQFLLDLIYAQLRVVANDNKN